MKKQILQLTFVAVFLGSLLAAGMCIFLLPQRKFSENENRYLAQLPSWNKSDICNRAVKETEIDFILKPDISRFSL